jgi:hypothetical protein
MSTVKKRAYSLTCDMADASSFYSIGGDYEGECKRQLLSAWSAARSAEKTGSRADLRLAVSRWRKARSCFEQSTGYSHRPRKGRS